jgi:signal transduction histidine kinase
MGNEPLSRFEESRLALARTGIVASEQLSRAIERAVVVSAQTLEVQRVGVWLFDPDEVTLRCVCQYDRAAAAFLPGQVVDVARWPSYRTALHSRKVLVAHDAVRDEWTAELADEYLSPLGITSMMDAPIFREGKVIGVVCHEHVGPTRQWCERDVEFAGSVSDMLTAIFESAARLALERQLATERESRARNERMVALGRLAAGIAHDFNGILAATLLASDVLSRDATSAEIRQMARELKSSAEVGRRLVAQLLTFARRRPGSPTVQDAREVVSSMAPMLDTLARNKGRLRLELSKTALPIFIDRSQLEQIVLNLVINALDATPAEKRVCVTLHEGTDCDRPCAVLRVNDEGPGNAPEVTDRIFEPFFSTKDESKGSGMGLATVLGIVEQAGGTIDVKSGEGGGATFVVRLPLVR